MSKKTYQVWHDVGWPQSRLNQMLGDWPPTPFPEGYVHVSNVQANGLREAVELTTSSGSLLAHLAGEGQYHAWQDNRDIENLCNPKIAQRDTDKGDVIVDPQGKAYRVEQNGFSEIRRGSEQEAFHKLLNDQSPVQPTVQKERDRGRER